MQADTMGLKMIYKLPKSTWSKDLVVRVPTAQERAAKGRGMVIAYGVHASALGSLFVAVNDHGLCWLGFEKQGGYDYALNKLQKLFPKAMVVEDQKRTAKTARSIAAILQYKPAPEKITLYLHGTDFQLSVWQAILRIPAAQAASYQTVAIAVGKPSAMRAVGTAAGANPICTLIPCHRVIQANGSIDNYGWGTPKKQEILEAEIQAVA